MTSMTTNWQVGRRTLVDNGGAVNLGAFRSIMAGGHAETVSNKYSFIPTTRVVGVLKDMGWFPCVAKQSSTRSEMNDGFQKHMIRFRQADAPSVLVKDEVLPEIVLTNSHDGLASFRLMAGLWRVICANGLCVATSTMQTAVIRHTGYTDDAVAVAVEGMAKSVPMIADKVATFSGITLNEEEQVGFAKAALISRYGAEGVKTRQFEPENLLTPYRREDAGDSLWAVYNMVQEKLIRGGRFERNTKETGRKFKSVKRVESIKEDIRINQDLWAIAEIFASFKTPAS